MNCFHPFEPTRGRNHIIVTKDQSLPARVLYARIDSPRISKVLLSGYHAREFRSLLDTRFTNAAVVSNN
jgi:hypothetical protein